MGYQDKGKRPPCIECGSENPISNGNKWLCKRCGRQWNKRYHWFRKSAHAPHLPAFEDRPPCPDCGKIGPVSRGNAWVCKECGRYWVKLERKTRYAIPPNTEVKKA